MKILQVNTMDKEGGAAVVAWNLFNAYRQRGHQSYFVVGNKQSTDEDVFQIPDLSINAQLKQLEAKFGPIWRLRGLVKAVQKRRRAFESDRGWENFHFPGSRHILDLSPVKPDLLHLHNLHGGYFDLRYLPQLTRKMPVVITLHDMWLLTGHCAHALGCDRWQSGCGECPDLKAYPPISVDGTAFNYRRKQKIYQRSKVHVVTPSQWLMNQVEKSILQDAIVGAQVIHNGVDTNIFKPANRKQARLTLGLPLDARILMFVSSHTIKNHPFKDYQTLSEALNIIKTKVDYDTPLLFLALGQSGETEKRGNVEIRFLPYVKDRAEVAMIYQAADLYVHAAKADVFPNSVLEALACGTPVVATGVGGIPEQIENGKSGLLTKPANPEEIAEAIMYLLENDSLRSQMGNYAAEITKEKFSLNHQIDQHLDLYQQILESRI